MQELVQASIQRIGKQPFTFVRSRLSILELDHRLLGLKGARGTGKTTLLLQFAKQQPHWQKETLYATLDNFWFRENRPYELADAFVKQGGKLLLLDEVHKYERWAQELKNIYDDFPELKVVFTGSSLLEILNAQADLSRRALVFPIQGLSFREFLALDQNIEFSRLEWTDLLENHAKISQEIVEKIKPLAHFSTYLKSGYYPFFKESKGLYNIKLEQVTNLILDIELPLLRKLDVAYVVKLKQLLVVLAQSVPFIPNMTKLAKRIGINRTTLLQYVHYLEEADLIQNIFKQGQGISKLQKPSKLLLNNTNLSNLLAPKTDIGALRETFFANQVGFEHTLNFAEKGDFLIDSSTTFEVGGKNKPNKQLVGVKNSFRALDDIEYGNGNVIPLWLFGFLY